MFMTPPFDKVTPHKINLMLIVSMILAISSMDIYLPCLPTLMIDFDTTEFMMQVSLMMNPIASSLVGIIFGRLSDTYGRRPMILCALGFFLVGSIGCATSSALDTFLINRFIQSIGCGGLSVLSVVVLTDIFKGVECARAMALYGALFPLVFAMAPILGAQLLNYFGWRSNFTFLTGAMAITAAFMVRLLPETHPKFRGESMPQQGPILERIGVLLRNRGFVLAGLVHALPVSLGALFTANAAFIFIQTFEFTPTQYSLAQALPVGLNFLTAIIYRQWVSRIGVDGAMKIGSVILIAFALGATAILMKFLPSVPSTYLILFCIVNLTGPLIVASSATKALMDVRDNRGLAVSIVALGRNLSVGCVVMATGIFFNGTFMPVLISMILVCLTVLGLLYKLLKKPEQEALAAG